METPPSETIELVLSPDLAKLIAFSVYCLVYHVLGIILCLSANSLSRH